MYCPRCASKIKGGANACKKCGFVFYEREQSVLQQAPPTATAAPPEAYSPQQFSGGGSCGQPAPPQYEGVPGPAYGAPAQYTDVLQPPPVAPFPPAPQEKPPGRLRIPKLVMGIVSIALSGIVVYQSMLAGQLVNLVGIFGEVNDTSALGGYVLATCMLAAGILGIVTRRGKGGGCIAGVLYILGGVFGIVNAGIYGDLIIWSGVSIVFGLIFLISCLTMPAVGSYPPHPQETAAYAAEEPSVLPYQAIGIPTLGGREPPAQPEPHYMEAHRPLAARWWFWLILVVAALGLAAAAFLLLDIEVGGSGGRSGDTAQEIETDEVPLDVTVQQYIALTNGYLEAGGAALRIPEAEMVGETLASFGENIVLTYATHAQDGTMEYLEGIVLMSVGEDSLQVLLSGLIQAADPSAGGERAGEMAEDLIRTASRKDGEQYTVERGGVYYALLCSSETDQYNVMVASVEYVRSRLQAAAAAVPVETDPQPQTEPEAESAGDSLGDTVSFGGLELSLLAELSWDSVEDASGEGDDTPVFLVPVAIRNASDELQALSALLYDQYGPDGQVLSGVEGLSDDVELSGVLAAGESMETHLPFRYAGDGEYTIQFILEGAVAAEVRFPVQRDSTGADGAQEVPLEPPADSQDAGGAAAADLPESSEADGPPQATDLPIDLPDVL